MESSSMFRAAAWGLGLVLLMAGGRLPAQDVHVRVDPAHDDGQMSSTEFSTIQMALDHAPLPGSHGRLYIEIAPGVYHQRVWVSQLRPNTTLLGQGTSPAEVVISAAESAKSAGGTFFTETVEINGNGFEADNLTFENAAGPVGQAVAVSVNADRVVFKHCRFLGDQDTLFANYGRQFYVDSYIQGGVDFIFGNAAAVFSRDEIHIIRPGYLTAQSRTAPEQQTGYVFDHVRVTAGDLGGKLFYLGRPWRAYARAVFMHSELPAELSPAGWAEWRSNTPDESTPYFAEFENTGPGAQTGKRAGWSHQMTAREAKAFKPAHFLTGTDGWDPEKEAGRLP